MNSKRVPFSEWACKASARLEIRTGGSMKSSSNKVEEMIIRDRVSRMKAERARYIRSFTR